jgi:hypothetical protein
MIQLDKKKYNYDLNYLNFCDQLTSFFNLKRLFMKLCKEIEDEEKSNAMKMPTTSRNANANEAENSSDEIDNINMSLSSSLSSSVFDMF